MQLTSVGEVHPDLNGWQKTTASANCGSIILLSGSPDASESPVGTKRDTGMIWRKTMDSVCGCGVHAVGGGCGCVLQPFDPFVGAHGCVPGPSIRACSAEAATPPHSQSRSRQKCLPHRHKESHATIRRHTLGRNITL